MNSIRKIFGGKFDEKTVEYLKDNLIIKYRVDNRTETHVKAFKMKDGYGIEARILPIKHGDECNQILSGIVREVINEIQQIVDKWERMLVEEGANNE